MQENLRAVLHEMVLGQAEKAAGTGETLGNE